MKKTLALMLAVMLGPLLLVSLFFNYRYYVDGQKQPKVDTVTVKKIYYDTLTTINPTPTNEAVVGKVAVPSVYFFPYPTSFPKDTACADTATSIYHPPDTVYLPRMQREYSDSSYTAWVSGYDPTLDSIKVRERTIVNTITITKRKEASRWNIGFVGGYGYGFQSKTMEPFIGIGVTYNLFK